MPSRRAARGAVLTAWIAIAGAGSLGAGQSQAPPPSAFFYQTVSPSAALVRAGATWDGTNIRTHDVDLVAANHGPGTPGLGDPVFSRLADGRWAMTARALSTAARTSTGLAYSEGACPVVTDRDVRFLSASSAAGCDARRTPAMGKSSQVVSIDGSTFVFTMSGGDIYLARLSSPATAATTLTSICMRQTAITSIHDLAPGDAGRVIASADAGLLLSDTAIARRRDGTWVLFVKGIAPNSGCSPASLCELCARSIYRSTSADLVRWTPLEQVVTQASVPEAVAYPDGTLWLYYQNFAPACAANDLRLAQRAPISGVYELDGGTVSQRFDVRFSNEAFESDTTQHYPTNANPIALPDMAAYDALNACLGRTPR